MSFFGSTDTSTKFSIDIKYSYRQEERQEIYRRTKPKSLERKNARIAMEERFRALRDKYHLGKGVMSYRFSNMKAAQQHHSMLPVEVRNITEAIEWCNL